MFPVYSLFYVIAILYFIFLCSVYRRHIETCFTIHINNFNYIISVYTQHSTWKTFLLIPTLPSTAAVERTTNAPCKSRLTSSTHSNVFKQSVPDNTLSNRVCLKANAVVMAFSAAMQLYEGLRGL